MLLLDTGSNIMRDLLERRFYSMEKGSKPELVMASFCDYDGIKYNISNPGTFTPVIIYHFCKVIKSLLVFIPNSIFVCDKCGLFKMRVNLTRRPEKVVGLFKLVLKESINSFRCFQNIIKYNIVIFYNNCFTIRMCTQPNTQSRHDN